MTNDRSPAELYFDELRHRAAALAQSLRAERVGNGFAQERGNRLRVVLANALPARFGVASGRVVSSSRKMRSIPVPGAVIYDQEHNSPLFHQVADEMFPIEMVLATVNRVPMLDPKTLDEMVDAVMPLRGMAQRGKFFQSYDVITKPNGKVIPNLRERRSDLPPRTYLLADSLGWDKPDAAAKAIKDRLLKEDDAHLDGVVVLDRDWFFHQPDNKHRIEFATSDGLIRFFQKLIVDLSLAETAPISLMRYAPE